MDVAKVPHALLILLLVAAPTALVESQPEVCVASIHVAGPVPLESPHDGSHCRLSGTRGESPQPLPTTVPSGLQIASPLFILAPFAVDARPKLQRVLVRREPSPQVALFLQTNTILL